MKQRLVPRGLASSAPRRVLSRRRHASLLQHDVDAVEGREAGAEAGQRPVCCDGGRVLGADQRRSRRVGNCCRSPAERRIVHHAVWSRIFRWSSVALMVAELLFGLYGHMFSYICNRDVPKPEPETGRFLA